MYGLINLLNGLPLVVLPSSSERLDACLLLLASLTHKGIGDVNDSAQSVEHLGITS